MNLNWKYQQWHNAQLLPTDENPVCYTNVYTYIGQNIYMEDIEIIGNILYPYTIEHNGGVIFAGLDLTEQDFELKKQNFDKYFSHSHSVSDAEKIINEFRLYDIFFGTSDNSSDETYQNVAEMIKKCWECHLMRTYPDKKFIVEISGEYEQFGITFYQEP